MQEKTSFDYLNWIEIQKSNFYEIIRDDADHLRIETDYAEGAVNIYHLETDVAELRIKNKKTEEDTFFLHFELKDEEHAEELFREMMNSLLKQQKEKRYDILLSCTSGLTTSFFAEQLNEGAQTMNLPYSFEAVPVTDVYTAGRNKDMILLAPQVGYMVQKVASVHQDIPVLQIPAQIFGSYDTAAALDFVKENLPSKKNKKELDQNLPEELDKLTAAYNVLSIGAFLDAGKLRFQYQVFENRKMIRNAEVLKEEYDLNDIKDLLDSVFLLYPEVNLVHMTMSGSLKHGKLTLPEMKIYDVDMKKWAEETYKKRFIFANDIFTITAGYYMMHPEVKNACVFVGADGSTEGAIGTIIDGHVHGGKGNSAGMISNLSRIMTYSENPWFLARTPEGTAELIGKYLVAAILLNAPERAAVFSGMVSEPEDIQNILSRYIPEHMMPEIVIAGDYKEAASIGALAHCVMVIRNNWKE